MHRLGRCILIVLSVMSLFLSGFAQEKKEDKSQEKSDRLTAMDVFNLQFAADPHFT